MFELEGAPIGVQCVWLPARRGPRAEERIELSSTQCGPALVSAAAASWRQGAAAAYPVSALVPEVAEASCVGGVARRVVVVAAAARFEAGRCFAREA